MNFFVFFVSSCLCGEELFRGKNNRPTALISSGFAGGGGGGGKTKSQIPNTKSQIMNDELPIFIIIIYLYSDPQIPYFPKTPPCIAVKSPLPRMRDCPTTKVCVTTPHDQIHLMLPNGHAEFLQDEPGTHSDFRVRVFQSLF